MDSKQFGNGESVKARVRLSPYGHNVFTRLNDLVGSLKLTESVCITFSETSTLSDICRHLGNPINHPQTNSAS